MIDLHVHSNFSDGSSSIEELLKEAQVRQLSLLSITDHNVVHAYKKLAKHNVRELFQGKIISGIEVTTSVDGEIIEILGYGFNPQKLQDEMKDKVLSYEDYKIKEFSLVKNNYKKKGIIFREDNVNFDPKVEGCRVKLFDELFQHEENVCRLLNMSSRETLSRFTRDEFYNPKSDFYVDQSLIYPSLKDSIEMIHNAGGLVFLAHPLEFSKNISDNLQNIIDRYEFDGLECYYSTFTEEQTKYLLDLCQKNNLLVSGGSDYHGKKRVGIELGVGNGTLNIEYDQCAKLLDKIKNYF